MAPTSTLPGGAGTDQPARAGRRPLIPQILILLSENWTMCDPRRLRRLVDYAVMAEEAGVDGVVVGEHVVMGAKSGDRGLPMNTRDWMMAGNQDPGHPHPSHLVVLSAIAAVTRDLRLVAAGVTSPLRHPLLRAKEMASLDLMCDGRLAVMPSVSWQREEYAALGIPFAERGAILDEQLRVWQSLWTKGSPISFRGKHFAFEDVYVEPSPYRPGGPQLWFGGLPTSPWSIRRTVDYGTGFFPVGLSDAAQLDPLRTAMAAAGRDFDQLQVASFVRGPQFASPTDLLDVSAAVSAADELVRAGVNTLVFKPSQFIDDDNQFAEL